MTKCLDCGYNDNGTGDSAHHCYRTPPEPHTIKSTPHPNADIEAAVAGLALDALMAEVDDIGRQVDTLVQPPPSRLDDLRQRLIAAGPMPTAGKIDFEAMKDRLREDRARNEALDYERTHGRPLPSAEPAPADPRPVVGIVDERYLKAPSTLGEQVRRAQAEYETWSPEKRRSVQLEGGGKRATDGGEG